MATISILYFIIPIGLILGFALIITADKSNNSTHSDISNSKPRIAHTVNNSNHKELSYNDTFKAIHKEIIDATTRKN